MYHVNVRLDLNSPIVQQAYLLFPEEVTKMMHNVLDGKYVVPVYSKYLIEEQVPITWFKETNGELFGVVTSDISYIQRTYQEN